SRKAINEVAKFRESLHSGERVLAKYFEKKATNWRVGKTGVLVGNYTFPEVDQPLFLVLRAGTNDGTRLSLHTNEWEVEQMLNQTAEWDSDRNRYLSVVAGIQLQKRKRTETLDLELHRCKKIGLRSVDAKVVKHFLEWFTSSQTK
ncbi:MAG: hypothetical protein Q7S79_04165, partial [bacterium]|nr:hypothetical protein [bacterium]